MLSRVVEKESQYQHGNQHFFYWWIFAKLQPKNLDFNLDKDFSWKK